MDVMVRVAACAAIFAFIKKIISSVQPFNLFCGSYSSRVVSRPKHCETCGGHSRPKDRRPVIHIWVLRVVFFAFATANQVAEHHGYHGALATGRMDFCLNHFKPRHRTYASDKFAGCLHGSSTCHAFYDIGFTIREMESSSTFHKSWRSIFSSSAVRHMGRRGG